MNKLLRNLGCCISFMLFIIFPQRVFASISYQTLFTDDFSSLDSSVWTVNRGSGSISYGNGLSLSSVNHKNFPFIFSSKNLIPLTGDYFIKFDYEYPSSSYWGVGFGLGNSVPEYGKTTTENLPKDHEYVHFQVWQSLLGSLIQTRYCSVGLNCESQRTNLYESGHNKNKHTILIEYIGNNFFVYLDQNQILNQKLLNSSRRPTVVWFGNSVPVNDDLQWTEIKISRVEIGRIVDTSLIKNPLILIPGIGASWNFDDLLSGNSSGGWYMPSFVTLYDGLIQSFENSGYKKDVDLFVFPYDWRKKFNDLSDDLNTFILSKGFPSGTKVDLVGHSMGGLVARSYINEYGQDKADKVLTLGSPNMGSPEAYSVWEGGETWGNTWWQKVAVELIAEVNRNPLDSRVKEIRNRAPSIGDLLPTYDFLSFGGVLKPVTSHLQKNEFLLSINSNGQTGYKSIVGTGIQSPEQIKVKKATNLEKLNGLWEDGKPIDTDPIVTSDGDGTVNSKSAKGNTLLIDQLPSWHNELVTKNESISKIFDYLGVGNPVIQSGNGDIPTSAFVAALRSPGKLRICTTSVPVKCDSSLGEDIVDHKLFILPGYKGESLSVEVLPEGTGEYDLYLGDIQEESQWKKIQGNLNGQKDIYTVGEDQGVFGVLEESGTLLRNLRYLKADLDSKIPGWDRWGYYGQLIDGRKTTMKRIQSAFLLRVLLRNEIGKANRRGDNATIISCVDLWKGVDRYSEALVSSESKQLFGGQTKYEKSVNALSTQVKNKLESSKSTRASYTFSLAEEKRSTIASDSNENIKYLRLLSTEWLLFTALDLK